MRPVLDVTFTPAAPYLLARSIGAPDLSRSFRGSVLQLAYPAGEHDATAHVWQRYDGTLQARIDSPDPCLAHDRLHQLLGVGLDTSTFLRMAADDPLLRPMTSRLRGLRPLMLATPVHALIRAVCGQLIRSSDALAIERRIVRRLGRPCGRFVLAPAAETLASAHPALLERAGLSPKRAVVLTRAARRLRLEALAGDPAERAELRIRREPGLGEWSVGVVMIYGFGRHERGLAGDLALVRLAQALGIESHRDLLARYGPWQGLASIWLMHHSAAARHSSWRGGEAVTAPV